jgi:hypothetical protein
VPRMTSWGVDGELRSRGVMGWLRKGLRVGFRHKMGGLGVGSQQHRSVQLESHGPGSCRSDMRALRHLVGQRRWPQHAEVVTTCEAPHEIAQRNLVRYRCQDVIGAKRDGVTPRRAKTTRYCWPFGPALVVMRTHLQYVDTVLAISVTRLAEGRRATHPC